MKDLASLSTSQKLKAACLEAALDAVDYAPEALPLAKEWFGWIVDDGAEVSVRLPLRSAAEDLTARIIDLAANAQDHSLGYDEAEAPTTDEQIISLAIPEPGDGDEGRRAAGRNEPAGDMLEPNRGEPLPACATARTDLLASSEDETPRESAEGESPSQVTGGESREVEVGHLVESMAEDEAPSEANLPEAEFAASAPTTSVEEPEDETAAIYAKNIREPVRRQVTGRPHQVRIAEFLEKRGIDGALSRDIEEATEIKTAVLGVTLSKMKNAQIVVRDGHRWYLPKYAPPPQIDEDTAQERAAQAFPVKPAAPPPIAAVRAFLKSQGHAGALATGIARALNLGLSAVDQALTELRQNNEAAPGGGLMPLWKLTKYATEPKKGIASAAPDLGTRSVMDVPPKTKKCIKCPRYFRPEFAKQEKCNVCTHKISTRELVEDGAA